MFSKASWDKLSKEDQALIAKLSRDAQQEQRGLWDAMVADSVAKLKAGGVTFVEVDKKVFYDATKPVREKYGAKHAALVKRIEDTK